MALRRNHRQRAALRINSISAGDKLLLPEYIDGWAGVLFQVPGPHEARRDSAVQDAVQVVDLASKGGIGKLQQLIKRKVEALEFKLGYGGYYGQAIKTYFEALSGSSHLRTVVVDDQAGKLFGVYNASDLISSLRVTGDEGYRQLERPLNSGNESARVELSKFPGFVGATDAVTPTTSKRDALARMESLNTDDLPVVDEQQRFIGTVGRSKLTAALILSVTDKLEGHWKNCSGGSGVGPSQLIDLT
jgi:CBS domain-containing protein